MNKISARKKNEELKEQQRIEEEQAKEKKEAVLRRTEEYLKRKNAKKLVNSDGKGDGRGYALDPTKIVEDWFKDGYGQDHDDKVFEELEKEALAQREINSQYIDYEEVKSPKEKLIGGAKGLVKAVKPWAVPVGLGGFFTYALMNGGGNVEEATQVVDALKQLPKDTLTAMQQAILDGDSVAYMDELNKEKNAAFYQKLKYVGGGSVVVGSLYLLRQLIKNR